MRKKSFSLLSHVASLMDFKTCFAVEASMVIVSARDTCVACFIISHITDRVLLDINLFIHTVGMNEQIHGETVYSV